MEISGYILTGMKRYREAAHSPVILDFQSADYFIGRYQWFSDTFEDFYSWPVSAGAKRLINVSEKNSLTLDDLRFFVRQGERSIICTAQELALSKLIEPTREFMSQPQTKELSYAK